MPDTAQKMREFGAFLCEFTPLFYRCFCFEIKLSC